MVYLSNSMSNLPARFLPILLIFAALAPVAAQQSFSGTPELEQSLHRLNELGTVLMIAAHPDDERTAVLAYFARGRHMRTAYLSVTRGEGGQNLIGPEQGAQLGLIRTQELLAARRIDGAEQFFTRAIDFGFTKTASETLEKWGHDRILGDIVWVIRSYRPDVVILVLQRDAARWPRPTPGIGDPRQGGLHRRRRPGALPRAAAYAQPWHAARSGAGRGLRRPSGGRPRGRTPLAEPPPAVPANAGEVDTGAFNPILGYSYEELAMLSRSMHHSQGTGAMRRPGPPAPVWPAGRPARVGRPLRRHRYHLEPLAGRRPRGQIFAQAIRDFEPAHPEKVIPLLAKADRWWRPSPIPGPAQAGRAG